jgi:hypothetical protein
MKRLKRLPVAIFFIAFMLTHPVWTENGGGDNGDDDDDDDDHHCTDHGHSHNHFMRDIGGYYNPGLWESYYGSGLRRPYGDCSYGYAGLLTDFIILTRPLLQSHRNHLHIQRQEAKPAQPRTAYWYYCQKPERCYPYAKGCPRGWPQLAPQPYAQ